MSLLLNLCDSLLWYTFIEICFLEKHKFLNNFKIILNNISFLSSIVLPSMYFYLPVCPREKEKIFLALGPDWFLLFTQSYLHFSTVVLGIKLLLCFLHNRSLLNKFKEGMVAGRWLENSSAGLNILMGMCWFNVSKTLP